MRKRFSAEVVDDKLILINANGEGEDIHDLTDFATANRQLLRWYKEHRFNYAKSRQELVEFFGRENCPAYQPPRSAIAPSRLI